jgi:hypothetical protein
MAVSRVASFSLLGLLAACAGAGDQDVFERSSRRSETSSTDPSPAAPPAGPEDDGSQAGTPATGTTPPTPAPAPACAAESEPNDDMAKATPFTSRFCGRVESRDDVDYGSFVAPTGATKITFKHSDKGGKTAYRVFVANVPIQIIDGPVRAIPGATYTVRVALAEGGGGAQPTYELDVEFE